MAAAVQNTFNWLNTLSILFQWVFMNLPLLTILFNVSLMPPVVRPLWFYTWIRAIVQLLFDQCEWHNLPGTEGMSKKPL